VLPPFHAFGLTVTTLLPLVTGCETLYLPRFEPQKVLELIALRGVTVFAALPSMYRVLARIQAAKPVDLSRTRWFIAGGEPLPRSTAEAFEKAAGVPLREGYGLTETAPVLTINDEEETRAKSCGRPLPGVEIRIADDGEIQAKGSNIMMGYHNLPDETNGVFTDDGWFRTGDLGYTDDDGYVYINGRAKELIISAGENIFPGEIEELLSEHPKVMAAAVVGAPDKVKGEVPVAHVQPHEGAEIDPMELRDFLKDKIAPFKVPREINIRELPIGPTGKVMKRML
jgi:long-chain acyl-CoA synthetase